MLGVVELVICLAESMFCVEERIGVGSWHSGVASANFCDIMGVEKE